MTKRIVIVVAYPEADLRVPYWASEEGIDPGDSVVSTRRTEAFAAVELKKHFEKSVSDLKCAFASAPPRKGTYIRLQTVDAASRADDFEIIVNGREVLVRGTGRTGTLYGAYEILRHQGWAWIEPGERGEVYEGPRDRLRLPSDSVKHRPGFSLFRGFDFLAPSMDSSDLLLWMARNRLNLASYRPMTFDLAHKLGMICKNGGHLFEALLDPDRPTSSGALLWDAHRDWFGTPDKGEKERSLARKVQFCMSHTDCIDYLADYIIEKLTTEWRHVDYLDVWPFDSWGQTCQCRSCRALGNGTDVYLHFGAELRTHINAALATGRLQHAPKLVLCAYEGCASIAPPSRPVPTALMEGGDVVVFYPINRCYEHDLFHADCAINARYAGWLEGWLQLEPGLPIVIGEYYGLSKFADLPMPFIQRISTEIAAYAAHGLSGMTYMHVPLVEWGVRRLTQCLYAELTWNPQALVHDLIAGHLQAAYGENTDPLFLAYDQIDQAWRKIADWRSWSERSALYQLLAWNGQPPDAELDVRGSHFGSEADIIEQGRKSIQLLDAALAVLEACHRRVEREDASRMATLQPGCAMNPDEMSRQLSMDGTLQRLREDRRGLHYGRDVMCLMTELTAYHYALLLKDDAAAEHAWRIITETASALQDRLVSPGYMFHQPGIRCDDGLVRSQLGPTIQRCAGIRSRAPIREDAKMTGMS